LISVSGGTLHRANHQKSCLANTTRSINKRKQPFRIAIRRKLQQLFQRQQRFSAFHWRNKRNSTQKATKTIVQPSAGWRESLLVHWPVGLLVCWSILMHFNNTDLQKRRNLCPCANTTMTTPDGRDAPTQLPGSLHLSNMHR
jgi:hypothetical protein